jgi:hypothetical protein
MRLFSRLLISSLVLTLMLSWSVTPAMAAKKKKKEEKKQEEKKQEVRHETRRMEKSVLGGANLDGKPGYFFSDTASTLNKGQVMGAAHLTFDSWGNVLQIPIGASFGISDKLLVNVNTSFFSANSVSGLYFLGFGGKYGFTTTNPALKIAAGLDFAVGPLSNALGTNIFGFDPYGVVTYTFNDGFQLNGKLGLYVQTYSFGGYSGSYSFFQCDLGAAYPFDANLTGIAELATNGVVNGGLGGTPLLVGIRTGHDVQFQAFGGLDFGFTTGAFVGGGIVLMSK